MPAPTTRAAGSAPVRPSVALLQAAGDSTIAAVHVRVLFPLLELRAAYFRDTR
jgi:hypothetical protein